MAPRSSALLVSYDIRPAKQCERLILVDSFVTAMECGLSISSYRYVGMGGNRFYDFVMMYKYLGINNMVSIEHDSKLIPRANFNRPFSFISLANMRVHDFLLQDRYCGNTIYWLDYDSQIDTSTLEDISALGTKVSAGDFVFVTVNGTPPEYLAGKNTRDRLVEVKDLFGDLAGSVELDDVETRSFPMAVHKVLASAFKNAFSRRTEGVFLPFFSVRYADSTEMVSLGGIFDCGPRAARLEELLRARMPLLFREVQDMYRIGRFDYTDKERRLMDLAVTAQQEDAEELVEVRALGFRARDIDRYRELLRYRPRYVETLV